MFKTRDLVTAGLMLAIGIILPSTIHLTGVNGAVFLPMHIPVLMTGFILGPYLGAVVGFLTPLLNHAITGMPPQPVLWLMLVELFLYGLVSGIFYKKLKVGLVLSLIISMVVGRIGSALALILLGKGFGLSMPPLNVYLYGITLTAIPGILIQILFIPILIKSYERIRY